jgi:hypothetical protein
MLDETAKIIGILLVLFVAGFSLWLLVRKDTKEPPKGGRGSLWFLGFLGVALIMQDRIIKLTTPIGTLETVTAKAQADAGDIAGLKTQAEQQTATINLVASDAAKAQAVSANAAAQLTEAQKKLTSLNAAATAVQATLDKVKQDEDFMMTVLAAESDSRESFDNLKKIADDKSNRFSDMAGKTWHTIFEAHSLGFFQSGFTVPWLPNVDPSKLSLGELEQAYQLAETIIKPGILEYIWRRNDIPKLDRLDFMMKVMKTDASLSAVEYAGRYFTEGTGQKIKPVAVQFLAPWWDEHRQEYVGK